MASFRNEMGGRLPSGMTLPEPIGALFDWIEARGFLYPSQRFVGDRFGTLQPLGPPHQGTIVLFRVETQEQAAASGGWAGHGPDPEMARCLVPFAKTGADGSYAAFWLDDAGVQHIVHLGSEGLICELGATPLEFLRLCAIGYSEISGEAMDAPHAPPDPSHETLNAPFVDWLTSTYGVTVPQTAADVIGTPPAFDASDSPDPFWRWMKARIG